MSKSLEQALAKLEAYLIEAGKALEYAAKRIPELEAELAVKTRRIAQLEACMNPQDICDAEANYERNIRERDL